MGNRITGLTPFMILDVDFTGGMKYNLFPFIRLFIMLDIDNLDNDSSSLLRQTRLILASLESYKGCGDSIKKAINSSSDVSLQRKGYDEVAPNIQLVSGFHDISSAVGKSIMNIYPHCNATSANAIRDVSTRLTNLPSFQGGSTQIRLLGELLLFCYSFDQLKVCMYLCMHVCMYVCMYVCLK